MRYRLATLDDADQLARLRWDFRAEDGERPVVSPDDFHARYTAFLVQGLASGQWAHWVAEDGGEIVAHMAVLTIVSVPRPSRRRDAWGYLTDCYTRPAHRSRGVGSTLLDHVKAWAAERDLELLVVSPSERSAPFYTRAGFGPDDEFLVLHLRDYDAPEREE